MALALQPAKRRVLVALVGLLTSCMGDDGPSPDLSSPGSYPVSFELLDTFGSTGPEDPAQPLGRMGGIDVDAEGRVYVADAMENAIRVFLPSGELLTTLGQQGEGPGEFSRLTDVFVTGSSVWAVERGPAIKMTRFSQQGDVIETTSWPFGSKMFAPPTRIGSRILTRSIQVSRDADPEMVVVADDDGARWDVLAVGSQVPHAGDATPKLATLRTAFLADGGWVVGWPEALHLWRYGSDGTLSGTLTLDIASRPVTDRDRAQVLAGMRSDFEKHRLPPEVFARVEASTTFPEFMPILERIVEGPDGTIWAKRNPGNLLDFPLDGASPRPDWYVFATTGDFLGVAQFPDGFEPAILVGDVWYGKVVGEGEVEFVGAYRVMLPSS